MASSRFHFVVPVLAKGMAGNRWYANENPDGRSVEAAVSRCISSLVNQRVPCVVHLVCHTIPHLDVSAGNYALVDAGTLDDCDGYAAYIRGDMATVIIWQADFPTPDIIDRATYERLSGKPVPMLPDLSRRKVGDKYSKIKIGLKAALNDDSAGFVMFVDHDDMLHRDVAAFALEYDGEFAGGHTVTQGYGWRVGADEFTEVDGFHRVCGSCNAVRLSDEEKDAWRRTYDVHALGARSDHWLFAGHSSVFARLRKAGRDTSKFPFRAAVYVTDTGVNISGTVRCGKKPVALSEAIKAEFGM